MTQKPSELCYNKALDLLARREHSAYELEQKLVRWEFDVELVKATLARLKANNLQSDLRFSESFIKSRISKGQGEIRIRAELAKLKVDESSVDTELAQLEVDWQELAHDVWRKKFGTRAKNMNEKARQIRFMQYRGFSADDIRKIVN